MPSSTTKDIREWHEDTKITFILKNPKLPGKPPHARYEVYKFARTLKEARSLGALDGDLKYDYDSGFVSKVRPSDASRKPALKFAHVISLGSRCLVADSLRDEGIRRYSGPFDWIYSSPAMVQHCISDGFATFLNVKHIQKAGNSYGHKVYSPMLNRAVIYPHHDPGHKDREEFARRVKRFKLVAASAKRKMFAICIISESEKALQRTQEETANEIAALFQKMRAKRIKNFELTAVHVVCGKCSEGKVKKEPVLKTVTSQCKNVGHDKLSMYELHCVGECTGLRLKNRKDAVALGKCFFGSGKFDLDPDPLGEESMTSTKKRKQPSGAEDSVVRKRPAAGVRMKRVGGVWRHASMD
eukprot:gb/GFBE01054691.1/.p1 GENE.gb/GFBE01054691.1/~~gb/GFBE01054691.1/.p1  ORF type:complete len:356 (+),score=59.70 gb/GFBE01054691.1/:1-1068(+)